MLKFTDLGLTEALLRAVSREGYENPTPIQAKVIPPMLDGHDIVGIAQTGTGKTAAFVLPILHRLADQSHKRSPKTCKALILAPTRELAGQIAASIRTYGRQLKPSTTLVVGGVRPWPQVKSLQPGVDIVVATPGRLLDHVATGAVRLDSTMTVVLDEADQMMDLGFMPAVRKIMGLLPENRQTVLLSATMPKQIRGLADDFLHRPVEVSVAPASTPIERIDQKVMHMPQTAKRHKLTELLKGETVERAIVFTRTKRGADRVDQVLQKAGLLSVAIHGDKSQGQRDRALSAFKNGRALIMVATDIAARGIDIDNVSHVFNFDLPNVPEAYVHRIGRTARAGRSGFAISFCDPSEQGQLRDIEKLIKMEIECIGDNPMPLDKSGRGPSRSNSSKRRRWGGNGAKQGEFKAGPAKRRNKKAGKPGFVKDRSAARAAQGGPPGSRHKKPA